MRNTDDYDGYDEAPLTPRCGYCRTPMLDQRREAKYCGRRCKELARERRKRDRERVEMLREKYPDADLSLQELYARATPPRHVSEDRGDDDEFNLDEPTSEASAGPGAWSDVYRMHEAEQAIRARYELQMEPYRTQLRRNPGVRPAGLVALERERDREIAEMVRAHDHAAQVGRAQRNETKRINEAHERQMERAALQAFSNDLPGGSRRYAPPEFHGRSTGDIWRW